MLSLKKSDSEPRILPENKHEVIYYLEQLYIKSITNDRPNEVIKCVSANGKFEIIFYLPLQILSFIQGLKFGDPDLRREVEYKKIASKVKVTTIGDVLIGTRNPLSLKTKDLDIPTEPIEELEPEPVKEPEPEVKLKPVKKTKTTQNKSWRNAFEKGVAI